jgi:hypothetical protein
MTERDLETVSLLAQLGALEATWRNAAGMARSKATDVTLTDEARYWAGYADMGDRAVQALRALGEQW